MTVRCTARPLVYATAALALTAPGLALGQQVGFGDEVGPYDPLGIRAGTFFIFPSLTVSEVYDDNVFATDDDEEDDFITLVQPRVRVVSNFPRHRLGLTAGGDIAFHVDETDEDYEDFFVTTDGRLDITRRNFVDAELSVERGHRDRDDPEDNPAQELSEFYRYGSELSFTQLFNRLNFRLTGRAERTAYREDFDADRDENSYDVLFRTGFFVSPRINTFVEGRYNIEKRDRRRDFAGIDRDSEGWGVSVGTAVDLTNLLVGEFQVGYRRQSFDQDGFDDEEGVGYGIDLTWTPTLLTTVVLSGRGDFEPTSQDEAESNFRSAVGLSVDHELLRNVIIGADVSYVRDDFQGDRTDNTVGAGAEVNYLINRNFSVGVGYRFTNRFSDEDDEEFTRNLIRVGITAQL